MRHVLLYVMLFTFGFTFAQTQPGYVKTLGRPDKPGVALSGVSVRVKGEHNAVLSKSDGTFSMLMTGKKNGDAYSLQQVQKAGYELNEVSVIGRQYAFSDKVPLNIVMVSTSQLQTDKQRIENNAYKVAERNYQAKMAQLEKDKDAGTITIETYWKEIQDLQDKFEKYQSLIDDLANHYAHTDYDGLDEKEREINICIENGDLERADSLIHTIFDPIDVLRRNKEALTRIDQNIQQANDIMTQANADMAAVLKQQEKDAEYLYQLYTIAVGRYDNVKALQYIVTRAALDTINANWQFDAARYLHVQNHRMASSFYERALSLYRELAKQDSQAYEPSVAMTLNAYGTLEEDKNTAEPLLKEALDIYRQLSEQNPQTYEPRLANTLINLGSCYWSINRWTEAEPLLQEAFAIYKHLVETNPQGYEADYANSMNCLALLYTDTQKQAEAELKYLSALAIYQRLAEQNPQIYEAEMAKTLSHLGELYYHTQRPSEAETIYKEALDIFRRIVSRNPQAYMDDLSKVLKNLVELYDNTQRTAESETLRTAYMECIAWKLESLGHDLNNYLHGVAVIDESEIAAQYCLAAYGYENSGNYAEAEKSYLEALTIYRRIIVKDSVKIGPDFAKSLEQLANLYKETGRWEESETNYKESIAIYRQLAEGNHEEFQPKLVDVLKELANLYGRIKRIAEAEALYKECISTYDKLANQNAKYYEPKLANCFYVLGKLYYENEYYQETEKVYKMVLPYYQQQFKSGEEDNVHKLAVIQYCLTSIYKRAERYGEAETTGDEMLIAYRRLVEIDRTSYEAGLASILFDLAKIYQNNKSYAKSVSALYEYVSLCRGQTESKDSRYWREISSGLGNLSFSLIFLQQFAEAEASAQEGLKADSTQHWIASNLAAALLFQGKYAEAETIYRHYKDELKDGFLDDFKEFTEAGIIPEERKEDVERIKQMLNEP